MVKNQKLFISDCEGPVSKNDNAFEIASYFIPEGDKLFSLVSKYDDILAYIVKRPGYKAGDTLKLILPFLKAYNATDDKIKAYSFENVRLMENAKKVMKFVLKIMPAFLVNTGYRHYTYALCEHLDFPKEHAFGTDLKLDKYQLDENEKRKLKEIRKEIVSMPMINIPNNARSLENFPRKVRDTIFRLNEIFWNEIINMKCGIMLKEIDPLGGYKKAEVVQTIAERFNTSLENVMYIGDSITDVEALRLVREHGGVAISFNGNEYAVQEAQIAVLSSTTLPTSILANIFNKYGKEEVINLAKNWNQLTIKKYSLDDELKEQLLKLPKEKFPKVRIVTTTNLKQVIEESTALRKKIRGENIGKLG